MEKDNLRKCTEFWKKHIPEIEKIAAVSLIGMSLMLAQKLETNENRTTASEPRKKEKVCKKVNTGYYCGLHEATTKQIYEAYDEYKECEI